VEVEAWDEDRVVSVTADPRPDMSELRCVGDLFPSAESRPKGRHLGLEPSILVVWEMVEVEAWGPLLSEVAMGPSVIAQSNFLYVDVTPVPPPIVKADQSVHRVHGDVPNACLVVDASTTPCNQDLVQVVLLSQSAIPDAMQVTCVAAHSPGASNAPLMESVHFDTRMPKLQGATTAHDVVADSHPVVA
jgi:hypothetical protein